MTRELSPAAREALECVEGEQPQWTVHMRVERNISVTVEAATEDAARAKAEEWDVVGDEMVGDTINWQITRVVRD